jgi:hypothetical protein
MSNFLNKNLVIMDEASVKNMGLNRSQFLQIAEGNTLMNVNEKGKTPTTAKINTNITVMTNSIQWAEVAPGSPFEAISVPAAQSDNIDSAYAARFNFFPVKSMPLHMVKEGAKEAIEDNEKGLVFLYLLTKSSDVDVRYKLQEINDPDKLTSIIESYKRNKQYDELGN